MGRRLGLAKLCAGLLLAAACAAGAAQSAPAAARARTIGDLEMVSAGAGWALVGQRLVVTGDGGAGWRDITPGGEQGGVDAAFFRDERAGWAVRRVPRAGYRVPVGPQGAGTPAATMELVEVAATTDGGQSWVAYPVEGISAEELAEYAGTSFLHFADGLHGWLVMRLVSGSNFSRGLLLATRDGGQNWERLPMPPIAGRVRFVSATEGWMAGGPGGGELYRTRDGGNRWEPVEVAAGAQYGLPRFRDARRGVLPVQSGSRQGAVTSAYRTEDGGQSWRLAARHVEPAGREQRAVATVADGALVRAFPRGGKIAVADDGRVREADGPALGGASPVRASFADREHGWVVVGRGQCSGFKTGCRQETRLLAVEGAAVRDITAAVEEAADASHPVGPGEGATRVGDPGEAEAAASEAQPNPGVVLSTNLGFDKCDAASASSLQVWWETSPFKDFNVYVGGDSRACKTQANVSPAWMLQVSAMGWGIIPTWVGPQAPCWNSTSTKERISLDPALAAAKGTSEAQRAVAVNEALGIPRTITYYDMEGYATNDAACSAAVKAFLNAWTREMHANGSLAGVYGSPRNIANDFAALEYVPDAIWIARWNNVASVFGMAVDGLPDSLWPDHQRIHQYRGDHDETWGGITFNIDNDIEDGPVASATAPLANYALTVTRAGSGTGTVSSAPAGIDCGQSCQAVFVSGIAVTLTAAAAAGSAFAGWGGACSGAEPTCTVTISAATGATATFARNAVVGEVTPNIAAAGSGAMTITVSGAYFDAGAEALWNGSARATTLVDSNTLTAQVTAGDLTSAGTATVAVRNPGATASNAVTFTISATAPTIVPAMAEVRYAPHIISGSGWVTKLTIANLAAAQNRVEVHYVSMAGELLGVEQRTLGPGATARLSTPETDRFPGGKQKWAIIGSEQAVGVNLFFELNGGGGAAHVINTVGFNDDPAKTSFVIPVELEPRPANAPIGRTVGIAYANPNNSPTKVTLALLNGSGAILAQTEQTLPAYGQGALDISNAEAFKAVLPAGNFVGRLQVTAPQPVSAVAIGDDFGPFYATPPIAGGRAGDLVLPHILNTGESGHDGWVTKLTLMNLSANATTMSVKFLEADGKLVEEPAVNVPSNGTVRVATAGAWGRVTSTVPAAANLFFEYWQGGVVVNTIGFNDAEAMSEFTIPVEFEPNRPDGSIGKTVGLALANTAAGAAEVTLRLVNAAGEVIATAPVSLPGNGKTAIDLSNLAEFKAALPAGNFVGLVAVSSTQPVAAIALGDDYGPFYATPAMAK